MLKTSYRRFLILKNSISNKFLCLFLNYAKVFIYNFIILSLLILYIIYRFLPENESLVILIYIIAFSSSLFYIEFIRIGI
jgi:hypothetical protein